MADIVESTPAELNIEGQAVNEKTYEAPVDEAKEKEDCGITQSKENDDTTEDAAEDAQATGVKRKSDDAENEDEEAKKVKKDTAAEDEADGAVNGSKPSEEPCSTGENNGKIHEDPTPDIPQEEGEVVKKVIDTEELPTAAEDVTASS